ncbi:MAG: SulP family inorganic anion transporter, partial [Patulibacter sp.]|nr:SulP family inorganic anion transporter [Patulibacter sp.]
LTVIATVATHNLAIGVGVGVLASMVIFARRVAHLLDVERTISADGTSVIYQVRGELFFASNEELTDAFHHPDDPAHVLIDMGEAHVWDASAVAALDAVAHKYESQGKRVEISGFNEPSGALHGALSGQLGSSH